MKIKTIGEQKDKNGNEIKYKKEVNSRRREEREIYY